MAMHQHAHHHHGVSPDTGGANLTRVAVMATAHCLTGCAIGEILGLVVGTALGLSNMATILLAVVLAFVFGYGLTSIPLLRSGLTIRQVVPLALAADTVSIAAMEVIDNLIMLVVPGAMSAGLDTGLFWAALASALAIAFIVTVPVNRLLIARGRGHAVVHRRAGH